MVAPVVFRRVTALAHVLLLNARPEIAITIENCGHNRHVVQQ
jgi:hypothetical protein